MSQKLIKLILEMVFIYLSVYWLGNIQSIMDMPGDELDGSYLIRGSSPNSVFS